MVPRSQWSAWSAWRGMAVSWSPRREKEVNDCGEPAVSQTWSELQLPMCSASLQETNSTVRRDVTLSRYRPPLIGHTAERSIAFRLSEMGQR